MLNLLPNSQSPHSRSPQLVTGLLRVPFFISPLNCLHSSPSLTASNSQSSLLSVPGVEAMNNAAQAAAPGIVVTVTRESLLVLTVLGEGGAGMH